MNLVLRSLIGTIAVGATVSSPALLLSAQSPWANHLTLEPDAIAQSIPEQVIPVARVNPQQPIQIRIVNGSSYQVAVALTEPPSATRTLEPGDSTIFGRLHTSYLPPPLNLFISLPAVVNNPDEPLDASARVSVSGNEIIVTIEPVFNANRAIPSTVIVNEAGSIFQY